MILLVDGNSIIHRAFHGMPQRFDSSGQCLNAVYGFLKMLFKIYDDESPTHIAIAFDLPIPTFRHKIYSEYKAGRKSMPNELRSQFSVLKDVLRKMNIKYFEAEGFEADDVLGTISKLCCDEHVIIYSGDSDLLQLATDSVSILFPKNATKFSASEVLNQYGLTPKQYIDFKALKGDSSDNIPGVSGIGPKAAMKIISAYDTLDNALKILNEKTNRSRVEQLLFDNADSAAFCKDLVTINTSVPINFSIDDIRIDNMFNDEAYEIFKQLEFNSLLNRFS